MIGVGFLTLPAIGRMNGWIAIIIFILIAQFVSLVGNIQIAKAYRICGKKTYSTIIESIIGTVCLFLKKFTQNNRNPVYAYRYL